MKFSRTKCVNMTSLKGWIETTLNDLVQTFGEPCLNKPSEDEKVNYEWLLKFEDGTIATIYDWKRFSNEPMKGDEIYRWYIGGYNTTALDRVHEAVNHAKKAKVTEENNRLEGTAEKSETKKTMNTIILNSETAANLYRTLKLELITHDIGFSTPIDIAKEITELGNDLQKLLSPITSVAYEAFREQFRTGCTLCFVNFVEAEKLEAWDRKNEDFQIAVFDNDGRPVGLYGKDVLSW